MIKYFVIIIIAITLGCNANNKEKTFIPRNFLYPIYQPGNGKLYIYQNVDSPSQYTFHELKFIKEPKEQFFSLMQYSSTNKFDSIKMDMLGNIIEAYLFIQDTSGKEIKIKGQILQNELLNTKRNCIIKYDFGSSNLTLSTEEFYIKDTSLQWKNKAVNCKMTEKNIKLTYAQTVSHPNVTNVKAITFYGEGLGMIGYSSIKEDKKSSFYLTDIKYL